MQCLPLCVAAMWFSSTSEVSRALVSKLLGALCHLQARSSVDTDVLILLLGSSAQVFDKLA